MTGKLEQRNDGWYIVDSSTGEDLAGPFASSAEAQSTAKTVGLDLEGVGSGSTWVVPSGDFAGLTWDKLMSALKSGAASEQDVRTIVAQNPPTSGGVTLGSRAVESDIQANIPGAGNVPDAAGNTPSGNIVKPISDVLGRVPTLAGAEAYAQSVAAGAPKLIPGAGTLPTTTTDADIIQKVTQGHASLEQAYNTLLAKGRDSADATNFLQINANAYGWKPPAVQQQPQMVNGIDINAVARPAQAGGSLGNGVRENLPYNGGPATTENLPFNPQTDSAQMQPLASYPAGSWQEYAAQAAQKAGIPPSAVVNLLTGEGSGAIDPNSGATWGILPSTAKGMGTSIEAIRADPHLGIDTAVQYLASNAPMFGGDVQKTLASYFIGAGNVQQAEKQAQQNGTDWLTEANKIAAQYHQGSVSDFFASHNLTGDSGTGAGTDTTGGVTGSATTASNQGQWVTGADGQTYYQPPTPKADLTPEQQLLLNQQSTLATQGILKNQQTSAVAAYKAQHPNATLYDLGKGDGSFKVEDPSAPQGAANTWIVQFDPSTGTMQEGSYAINPAVSTLSTNGLFGNTAPTTGVLNGGQIANGTEATRALLAIDPAMAGESFAAAHGGRHGTDQEIQAWLGTSTGTNQSQDYADLLQNQATLAATGHTYQDYTAQGGVGTNTPINVAKSLGSTASGITALTPNERNVYNAYGASAFNPSAITTKMQDPQTGEMVPVIGGNSAMPLPQAGTQVQVTGPDGTMQMVDAQQKALADFRNSTPEGQGQDNGGDVTQFADWQSGHADGLAAAQAGQPDTPSGNDLYVAGFKQGYRESEANRVQQVNNTYNDQFTKQYGSPVAGTPVTTTPIEAGPTNPYTKPAPPPPPVAATPPPPEPQKNPNTPVYRFANGGQVMAGMTAQQPMANGFSTPEEIGFYGMKTGKLYAVAGEGKDGIGGKSSPEMINVTPMNGAPSGITAQPSPINLPMTALGSAPYKFSGYK